jgi:diguanylate cyclase (GGDEF)-like protein
MMENTFASSANRQTITKCHVGTDRPMESILHKFDRLPSMPGVAMKLIEIIQKKDPDIREINRLISSDATLTAKVLKLVNSSSYGLLTKITTIDQAIRLLGLNAVKNLSLSLILKTRFLKNGSDNSSLTSFWKDSLVGAIAAKLLAERLKLKNAEDTFFLGLLEDIGSLTLAYLFPAQYAVMQSTIKTHQMSTLDAENQVFGFNHMVVGAILTESWGFPEAFTVPIQYHHTVEGLPKNCSRDIRNRTLLLHLSSLYIELLNSENMTEVLGRITHLITAYGFQGSLDAAEIAKELIQKTKEIFPIFDLHFSDEDALEHLLESAKQELLDMSMQMVNDLIGVNSELESLRQQANKDAMTQLHNYKAFCEALNQEISRATRYRHEFCHVLADIDFFKSVNDTFGHPAGDRVLKTVARALQKGLRDCDFVARYGGEEFAIILPETRLQDALHVAERLRQKIRGLEISYEGQPIRVTMSFGVAAFRHTPAMSFNELLKAADAALYTAKKQGRDRCCTDMEK